MLLYRKKLLQEENVVRKILQPRQLFLQQQYNFSQFATFSSCNLYSKGSNRCPLLISFLIFFTHPILHPPLSLFIIFSNLFEPKKKNFFFTMSDIHALNDIHARYYQILLIFLTLIVVWG